MLSSIVFLPARLTIPSQSRDDKSVTPASVAASAPRSSERGASASSGASSGIGRADDISYRERLGGASGYGVSVRLPAAHPVLRACLARPARGTLRVRDGCLRRPEQLLAARADPEWICRRR